MRRCAFGAVQLIKWAYELTDESVGDMSVAQRGGNGTVAKKGLKNSDIGASFQEVCSKAVSKRVHGDFLGKSGLLNDLSEDEGDGAG